MPQCIKARTCRRSRCRPCRPGLLALRCAASLIEGSGGGIPDIPQGCGRLPLPPHFPPPYFLPLPPPSFLPSSRPGGHGGIPSASFLRPPPGSAARPAAAAAAAALPCLRGGDMSIHECEQARQAGLEPALNGPHWRLGRHRFKPMGNRPAASALSRRPLLFSERSQLSHSVPHVPKPLAPEPLL